MLKELLKSLIPDFLDKSIGKTLSVRNTVFDEGLWGSTLEIVKELQDIKRAFQEDDFSKDKSVFSIEYSLVTLYDTLAVLSLGKEYWKLPREEILEKLPVLGGKALLTYSRIGDFSPKRLFFFEFYNTLREETSEKLPGAGLAEKLYSELEKTLVGVRKEDSEALQKATVKAYEILKRTHSESIEEVSRLLERAGESPLVVNLLVSGIGPVRLLPYIVPGMQLLSDLITLKECLFYKVIEFHASGDSPDVSEELTEAMPKIEALRESLAFSRDLKLLLKEGITYYYKVPYQS